MNIKRIIALGACALCLNGGLSLTSQAVADSAYSALFGELDSLTKPRKRPVHKIMTTFVDVYKPDLMELQGKLISYKAGLGGASHENTKGKRAVDKWYKYVSLYITYNFEVPAIEGDLPLKPHGALFTKVPELFEDEE